MNKRLSTAVIVLFLNSIIAFGQKESFQKRIDKITQSIQAQVGIGILDLSDGRSFYNLPDAHLPMQSMFKFHLALAVLDQVDQKKLSLDQKIQIKKSDLRPDTWSPLRDKYPEGNVAVTIRELVRLAVSDSDNNACDILFRLVGGPKKVHQHLQKLGIKDLQIVATEEEMGQSWAVQYTNWTSPKAMVQLLQKFYEGNILSKTSHDFLWKIMVESSTGLNRLKKSLPKGTIIAHKTGTSGSKDGIMGAVNDAGVVVLPNGKRLVIVVLVSNSKANIATNEAVIAKIAKVASEHF